MSTALYAARPVYKGLVVPFVVNEAETPIDFKRTSPERFRRCAVQHRCGICGTRMKGREWAFIGPNDSRRCFADPWMHLSCARFAMQQCPFLGGRDFADPESREDPLIQPYRHNMVLYVASGGSAHQADRGTWHYRAEGLLWKPGRQAGNGVV